MIQDSRRTTNARDHSDAKTAEGKAPKIPKELLDQLITGPTTQGEFETIYRALKKPIIERAMSMR